MLGIDFGKWDRDCEGYRFALNVLNVADEKCISSCFDTETCYVDTRRTVYGTLSYKWLQFCRLMRSTPDDESSGNQQSAAGVYDQCRGPEGEDEHDQPGSERRQSH